jgi:hypothetical protein
MGKSGWDFPPVPLPVLFDVGVGGLGLAFVLRTVRNFHTFGFFKTVNQRHAACQLGHMGSIHHFAY